MSETDKLNFETESDRRRYRPTEAAILLPVSRQNRCVRLHNDLRGWCKRKCIAQAKSQLFCCWRVSQTFKQNVLSYKLAHSQSDLSRFSYPIAITALSVIP